MANDLAPNYVQIRYQSSYGLHVMTLPTRVYTPGATITDSGTFPRWSDDGATDAFDMIELMEQALQDGFHTTTTIIDATIFAKTAGVNDSTPVGFYENSMAGSNAGTEWRKATQMTLTFRTTLFGTAKIVTLDTPHAGFDRFTPGAASAWVIALAAAYTANTAAWAGRDGGRPNQWLQGSVTLNEKLRRSYGMT